MSDSIASAARALHGIEAVMAQRNCIKRRSPKRVGPLFVFLASATVSGLLGHAALLSSARRPIGSEWATPAESELFVRAANGEERVALNGDQPSVKSLHRQP
jgi:hypothetical protein